MADNVTIEVEERVEEYIVEVQESIVTIDSELTETSTNPVKSSGIWTWVKGLFTTHTTEADAHPASAISVDASEFEGNLDETVDTVQKLATAVDELEASQVITEPLTPSNDAVAVGDGFQEIGEKLAGLQDDFIREIEITESVNTIEITTNHLNLPLNIKNYILICYEIIGFVNTDDAPVSGRLALRFNDILTNYNWGNTRNSSFFHVTSSTSDQIGILSARINNNGINAMSIVNATSYGHNNSLIVSPITKILFSTFVDSQLVAVGSRLKIYGR